MSNFAHIHRPSVRALQPRSATITLWEGRVRPHFATMDTPVNCLRGTHRLEAK